MSRRRYSWKYIFIETDVFVQDHGTISKADRNRLYFDLAQGRGGLVARTGGLKRIQCGLGGYLGESDRGWEVTFAEYNYPDIRRRVFVLVDKCPLSLQTPLDAGQEEELRGFKERLDALMDRYYDELRKEYEEQDDEANSDEEDELDN